MPRFRDILAGARVLFFCGKGGVGKTTLAAATALASSAAQDGARRRVLVLGTDPAAALPRVLGRALEPGAEVEVRAGVAARQVEGDALLERFRAAHGATLAAIVEGGTYLAREDAEALARASLPGVDEVLALLEIADAAGGDGDGDGDGDPDRLVLVDTAPSGHAQRLLALPRAFAAFIEVLEAMRAKARAVEEAFARRAARESAADRLLASLRGRLERLRALLASPRAGLVAVAVPEPGAVVEARRLADALAASGPRPVAVVLNAVEGGEPCCREAERRARAADEARIQLQRAFPGVPVLEVRREDPEPLGVEALTALGETLLAAPAAGPQMQGNLASEALSLSRGPQMQGVLASAGRTLPVDGDLVLVGGKGGVGKSTIAAALAVKRALERPDERVLLASIGPSRGLSRALGLDLGDEPRVVPGLPNLEAVEVDAISRFERVKEGFRADVERALDSLLGPGGGPRGLDLRHDRAVVRGLLDLTPPGVDEVVGLGFLAEALDRGGALVLDCAPTGHLARFLEMPRLAREWLSLALGLLGKYPELASASAVERTVSLLRRVRAVATRLADPARAALVAVTLPERLPVEETAALEARARAEGVRPAVLVVNRAEPEASCPRCAARRAGGLAAALALAAALGPAPAFVVPELPEEPRGPARLAALPFAPATVPAVAA